MVVGYGWSRSYDFVLFADSRDLFRFPFFTLFESRGTSETALFIVSSWG